MNINNFTEFNLPKDAYTAFEAETLKNLIIARLNENQVFRDQNFEGSNINAFIDIVAYMYHVLIFYLNSTSTESNFTTASLYENINRLVSLLGYKPLGKQTSLVALSLSADSGLAQNTYLLPRFSFINANGIPYTTIKDISFEKTTTGTETLYINNNTLMQGNIIEAPTYAGVGENFETYILVNTIGVNNANFIADNSFTVFVLSNTDNKWYEWQETSSLYLETANARKYEKRLNENGNYEFKFGNDVTGKSLKVGEQVKVFYILSDGATGEIGAGVLKTQKINLYSSASFIDITQYIYDNQTRLITGTDLVHLFPNNNSKSSPIADAETAEQIKQNAPKMFTTQDRLVTQSDYKSFITKNYNNIIKSVNILSNEEFTSKYLAYFYKIGLNRPNEDCRVLFNQVFFAPSTNFNSVYVFTVPKISTILNERTPNYLNASQKQLLINECNLKKDITQSIVCMDPIYKAFSFGLQIIGEVESVSLKDNTYLVIKRDINTRINSASLKGQILNIFKTYFSNIQLGDTVNLNEITNDILNIVGVKRVTTRRSDTGYESPQINYVVWNPLYEQDDVTFITQNYTLDSFMYAYFYEISNLTNKIIIEDE